MGTQASVLAAALHTIVISRLRRNIIQDKRTNRPTRRRCRTEPRARLGVRVHPLCESSKPAATADAGLERYWRRKEHGDDAAAAGCVVSGCYDAGSDHLIVDHTVLLLLLLLFFFLFLPCCSVYSSGASHGFCFCSSAATVAAAAATPVTAAALDDDDDDDDADVDARQRKRR